MCLYASLMVMMMTTVVWDVPPHAWTDVHLQPGSLRQREMFSEPWRPFSFRTLHLCERPLSDWRGTYPFLEASLIGEPLHLSVCCVRWNTVWGCRSARDAAAVVMAISIWRPFCLVASLATAAHKGLTSDSVPMSPVSRPRMLSPSAPWESAQLLGSPSWITPPGTPPSSPARSANCCVSSRGSLRPCGR